MEKRGRTFNGLEKPLKKIWMVKKSDDSPEKIFLPPNPFLEMKNRYYQRHPSSFRRRETTNYGHAAKNVLCSKNVFLASKKSSKKPSFYLFLQLKDVNRHSWAVAGGKGELELEAPMMDVVQTHIIPSRDAIDEDVLRGITSLGCFKEREKLVAALLENVHNTEKVIYFLLLDRKKRKPAFEDEDEVRVRGRVGSQDPPRKRVDSYQSKNGFTYSQLSQGSPLTPRRQLYR